MIPVEVPEDIELAIVREGRVQVEVPVASTSSTRGPARADAPVFYNPAMELARDVSVSLVRVTGSSSWRVLDGLAGTTQGIVRMGAVSEGTVSVEETSWSNTKTLYREE